MYLQGLGVAQNPELAAIWTSKAARAGDTAAQNNLGIIFENGIGVTEDKQRALRWYMRAASNGSNSARESLSRLMAQGVKP
ncbi:sel1 repeat family protein [Denitrobaculum tricleocarpae]|uniref:Sel1 repeat family protein n=2 Tax=Denitrobaculum tricleocarpae TaxID=2591009 RepID=A0A545TN49_9PROT|nr:sel1 repeat family protein [Denitrobaculum tricleocarpae]